MTKTKTQNIRRLTIAIEKYAESIGEFTLECPSNLNFKITGNELILKSKSDKLLDCLGRLSVQEQNVLRELVEGKRITSKEIAAKLKLEVSTISTYRSRIIEKLEIKSTAELPQYKDILIKEL